MEIKINLIPDYKKKEIIKSKRFSLVIRLELIILALIGIFFAFLFGLNIILDLNYKLADSGAENGSLKAKFEEIEKYDREFKDTNPQVKLIDQIGKEQLHWSKLLIKISQSGVEEISLSELSNKDYSVFLVGKAKNRDSLIAFKERLEKNNCFSSVNLPLSNLVSKGDIDFQMDMALDPNCIHENQE